ncbi:hypothetical protein B296_00038008 [Ensete ventricosum]|uniref:Uncharacterized protein n=1 Tax=Ensete ventricosum TaxID=4639 RepID=A0A426X883_ENSVE|nr:hypothetical protein B296_00038008 [Ensete ventricosum]
MKIVTLCKVKFQSVFLAPSRKFKILAIPNVLAHGKSYEYGFMKKYDDHKLCAKSSVNQYIGNSKYWLFLMYLPMGTRMSMVSRKNVTIINSNTQNHVSIRFSCTISKT